MVDEIFTLLPKLFYGKIFKTYEQPYQSCGSIIKICKMEQKKSTNGTNVCGKRYREKYFELCWFFKKKCYVIKYFSELKQDFGKEGIAFTSSSSSIAIEWRNEHLIELELYVDKIDTSLYGDFTINTRHFKDYFIFILGNDMRDTCGGIYKNNINSWGFFSLPCV